jgi:hypothetical protein
MSLSAEQRRALSMLKAQVRKLEQPEKRARKAKLKAAQRERRKAVGKTSEGQRQPRKHDLAYLSHVRFQPCILATIAGDCQGRTDPAHLRFSDAKVGRRNPGAGNKSDDKWVLPLCRHHHDAQHAAGNERRWWSHWGIDPNEECERLYAAFRDHKAASAARAAQVVGEGSREASDV